MSDTKSGRKVVKGKKTVTTDEHVLDAVSIKHENETLVDTKSSDHEMDVEITPQEPAKSSPSSASKKKTKSVSPSVSNEHTYSQPLPEPSVNGGHVLKPYIITGHASESILPGNSFVVAESEERAAAILERKLIELGLGGANCPNYRIREVDLTREHAYCLSLLPNIVM